MKEGTLEGFECAQCLPISHFFKWNGLFFWLDKTKVVARFYRNGLAQDKVVNADLFGDDGLALAQEFETLPLSSARRTISLTGRRRSA